MLQEEPAGISGPDYMHTFRAATAKPLISQVLEHELADMEYKSDEVPQLSQKLGSLINRRLAAEPGWTRYKFITSISLFETKGQGAYMGCRTVWDPQADSMAQVTLATPNIKCVAAVFAIYVY
ncbi:Tctex1 domain-containing protein 2 [Coemansia sp. RSA 2336]|nr:Tctex1 domain-containing protein 2 [Coemansia sp. RSA 2336]